MINQLARQVLNFAHLPSYAAFLQHQHIDDYVREMLRLSEEINLPMLKFLKRFSDEEIFQISKNSSVEFLTSLNQNNVKGHIETSTQRWLSNQLQFIKTLEIEAEDITLINYVRARALKKWAPAFAKDNETVFALYEEIENLTLYYNTTSTNSYIKVLKANIEEEAHFNKNIINASPGITFIYDLQEQKEIYINGRVKEVTGFTQEEVLAKKDLIAELTHPEDMGLVLDFMRFVIEDKEGKTNVADYRFRNRDGSYHWMRCYAVVYKRDLNGQATHILGTAFEITKEKDTAEALLKRERQLLEAQAISKIGSYEWDLRTDTSLHTPELSKIFETETGKGTEKWMEKVHPDDVEKVKQAIAESFQTGRYASEFRYRTKSGVKVVLSKGEVTFDESKKPLILIGTIQDITEQKKIEENLLNNAMELQRSNKQLEEFAFVASHDLKEPLRKIGLYSNIIMTTDWDTLSEKTKANIQKISDAAVRMQKLIEGILSYSSITAQSAKEQLSLEQLLKEALNNLEFKIKETGAIITSDGLPTAEVYSFQIQQLFQNLVGNALKFSRKEATPEIKITHSILHASEVSERNLQPAKEYLQIKLSDNGIGFSNEAGERIFGLFQRLHNRSEYEGSGLGLAICKKIVENHGGTIKASSETGVGSTFIIILPTA